MKPRKLVRLSLVLGASSLFQEMTGIGMAGRGTTRMRSSLIPPELACLPEAPGRHLVIAMGTILAGLGLILMTIWSRRWVLATGVS